MEGWGCFSVCACSIVNASIELFEGHEFNQEYIISLLYTLEIMIELHEEEETTKKIWRFDWDNLDSYTKDSVSF